SVPREDVPIVTDVLLEFYTANRLPGEKMGYFFRRIGNDAIVQHLKENPRTAKLMERTDRRY
ncbi:hypothetical protein HYR99_15850, partial [Candidatus Poribacteria bacterium]|nr:hypothetical protein [Candidatus Poribacteria bacterium]